MELKPMRFKNYTWPHNPEVYSVEARRQVAVHKVPFGQYVLQDLGATCRVLEGQGVFAGEGAYDQFRELEAVFGEGGPGLLVHPVWQAASAYFVTLRLEEEPLPDFVRYSFAFWEDCGAYYQGLMTVAGGQSGGTSAGASNGKQAERTVYTVRKGDTLWGIAKRYNVTLTALIAANPGIRNPNLIYPGDKVVIP
ncbi:LysM peptidoglycan-binding domain-containing protein [Dysosmobacter sp.]|uniref:LysM peptidoglycan-binding domain-containing protein n=1 Tax=Dysosmobacter sp. TaxID=2591382 RepID=UPI002A8E5B2F|nr:LysM peptidoglycan-binding domain-containing protein [Dysosmobacter sp.]MDY3985134.1 LysM peptidoglycan-binding domain-containing protein [Dysosmobacter sp.]